VLAGVTRPATAQASRSALQAAARTAGAVAAALACVCLAAANSGAPSVKFDLPAAAAEKSLRLFSRQAGVEVVFASSVARGVRTRPVKGEMPPRAALDAMLTGTGLVVFEDSTGAFSIRRDPPQPRKPEPSTTAADPLPDSVKKNEANPTPPQTMKNNSLLARITAGVALAAGSASMAQVAPALNPPPANGETTIELSPFLVTADADDTWLATSTLAGSRLNTPLRDTGASISVLTSEFLRDLGAIDLEEVAGYAVNIHFDTNEGTNVNDNWALQGYDTARVKIRGVAATVTRNYFRWGLQTDSYNADRIEENRGPNSILFGIGSAGGVVNTLTKRANLGRDFRRVGFTVGSYGSYRGTVDLNQRVLDGRLGVRVNAVHSEQGNYRHHAFNDTQRLHLASTWQVRDRTRLRLDYEIGRIENIGMRPAPAFDGVGSWLAVGAPTIATVQTGNLPAQGITRYSTSQRRLTYVENLGAVYNYQGQNRATGNSDVILDQNLASFRVNPVGPYNRRDANLQNLSLFFEEKLAERTFLELSHNLQIANRDSFVAGLGRTENATLYADPHLFLPDGSPNPYAGALMFEGGRWNTTINRQKSHNTRLMLSHEMDFGKWGNYRLAGMGEYEWRKERVRNWVEAWEGRPFSTAPENDQNQVWRRFYVTPGDWATYHSGTGPMAGLLQGVPDPTNPARTLNSTWVPFSQNSQRDPYENQTTLLFGGHARYFAGRLVLGFGFRQDELKLRAAQAQRHPVTNEWSVDHAEIEVEREKYKGSTRTLGAVGHATRNISVFYNYSNSLDVPNTQHRILPDGRTPPTSEAQGHDFGLGLSFFDGRLSARANRFTVDMIGATGGGFSGTLDNPTVLNNRVLSALVNNGVISQQVADERDFTTNQSTIDRKIEGYEFNMSGALTKNWRLQVSYSYTDGYDSNIGPEVKAWFAEAKPWYLQYGDVMTSVEGSGGQSLTVAQLVAQWEADVQRLRWVREGDLILGNRKHKYSVFTRYSFDRGPLKGLYVGGGYRRQGKAPLGFDSAEQLQWGKPQGEADGLLGYRFRGKKWFLKSGPSVQLNVRNLLDRTDPRVTTLSSDSTRVRRAVIIPPRSWRLTANFEF
jgi:iron complex outermembrane recepter protein